MKKYAQKEPSRKGPQSRDQRRAMELKIPFTIDEIIESPVETFNEMINAHKLNDAQVGSRSNSAEAICCHKQVISYNQS